MTKSTTTASNTTLQLFLPKIKGQTVPVEGGDAGLPLLAYDLVGDGEGAEVQIDPPLVGTWRPKDVVKLWLVNETALLSLFTIDDPNVPIFMRIPRNRLHPDQVNLLYYTVERPSENVGKSDPPLKILYNRIRPGLKDRFPDLDGHSELKLLLPEVLKNGVGPDFVSAEVCVAYPYCRAYDVITLKCNGELLEPKPKVKPNPAPLPPDPGTDTPITTCFTITRDFLDKAKRQDKKLHFSYTVTDQIGNGPDTDAPWSPVQSVDEDLDGTLLDKPILREIAGDTTDEPGIIDLKKLGSNSLLMYISTVDARFEPDDKIEATYTAKIPGQADKTVELKGQVETDDIGNKITCLLKVLNEDVIVASSVSVKYKLLGNLDNALKAESNIATATVEGEYMELKPAGVQQATGNTLAPMAAVSKLTIVVPQGTTLPTDLLSVSWIPEPGTHAEGSFTSDPRPISDIGLSIDIPPPLVAFCLGGKATVIYTITRGNGQPKPSDPFILNVQELPQAELLAPRLKEASNAGEGTELNLAELTSEGKMWFAGFPFNAVGQYVWLLFKGTNADGSAYEKYIWAAPFAFVNDDWVRNGYFEATTPYEDLKGLKDGTPLIMEMWVAFGKSEDLGLAKRFLIRTYIVSAVEDVEPTIDSVKGSSSGSEIPNNEITTETAIVLSGSAANGQQVEVFDGKESKGKATASDTGVWNHPDNNLVEGDHSYKVEALYGTGQVSAERNLTVVPALSVDTSPVNLSGRNYTVDLAAVGWELTGTDLPDTAVTRTASGGKAPYTYTSSAPGIASVDSTGRIRSVSNGAATIIVSDALGQSREIPVLASNVKKILYGGTNMTHAAAESWMVSVGGSPFPPDRLDLSQFNQKFRVLIAGDPTDRRYFPGRYLPSAQVGFTWVQPMSSGMGPFVPASTGGSNSIAYIALCMARAD